MAVSEQPLPVVPDWRHGTVARWVVTTDHKKIGVLYIVTAFAFFVAGGVMAALMRAQLAWADQDFVTRETYNQLFTMHGTTMIFLFVVPVWAGFANYLLPLMLGSRDMAFPRLNAFSYWMFLAGGLVLMASFGSEGGAARGGWYSYPPYTELQFSPWVGQDLWILGIHLTSIASIAGAINFLVTIHYGRAPGMRYLRLPLFVWATHGYSVLLVVAIPVLSAAATLLLLDRQAGTGFFDPTQGGDPVLWQHFFWFFGHPEVYIMILPAFGVVSEVLPVFSGKPLFGYRALVYSILFIVLYSLLVWAHHMFTIGSNDPFQLFFMATSLTIAVPTGVKIFNWLATIWRGNLRFDAPMLFALGLIGQFVIGGLTGVFVAVYPFDFQAHDSYYVVGHMHYVLFGGTAFGLFAACYYWFPKITGRMYDERLARWHFWLVVAGFNLTFFPHHMLGLLGMSRRIYTYEQGGLFGAYNLVSSIGTAVMTLALVLFFVNLVRSWRSGRRVGNDPWQGDTLEWITPSPPPEHNFERVPYVTGARPLRDLRERLASRNRGPGRWVPPVVPPARESMVLGLLLLSVVAGFFVAPILYAVAAT
jgi:cytochrome c oxidase subunit 1